jgi:hypothetical protein
MIDPDTNLAAFSIGDTVTKTGGDYRFSGTVVSAFSKKSGKVRYVVENEAGILHIFSGKQLAKWHVSEKMDHHCCVCGAALTGAEVRMGDVCQSEFHRHGG